MNGALTTALPVPVRKDGELVVAVAGGDLSALGLLFDRYSRDIRRLLARLGTPAADLDHLVQQTFIDVLRASSRFDPAAAVKPWLLGLATIVVRRRRRSVARMFARLHEWAREPVRDTPTPDEELELRDTTQRAQAALDALPQKKREAFVLVVLEGMTCAEAGAALGVPIATVWTRIHYARAELRRVLDDGDT